MGADDDRPRVVLSLAEQVAWIQLVNNSSYRNPRQLLDYWMKYSGPIRDPLLDAAFRSLWRSTVTNERQQDHG